MKKHLLTAIAASVALAGCADRPLTYTETGALIGAASGAVIGAVAYKKDRTKGAVVGAVGGGLAGAGVGAYMDAQKRDLEKNLAQESQAGQARVEKLPGDVVRVTMTNQTAFETIRRRSSPGSTAPWTSSPTSSCATARRR